MADRYVIDTIFRAHDQMSSSVNGIADRMTRFGRTSTSAFDRASKSATKFKTILGGVLGANLITAGLGRLRQGLSSLTDEFLDFDQAITSAASKYKFDRGTEEFEELGRAARDVAAVTPYTAAQAGNALNYLAMAGFTAQQSMSALPSVTNLAIAGNMDLAQASDIASDALGALGMSTAPDQISKSLSRFNDVAAMVANTANTDIPMLWESLKPVASVASQLGASVEELGAMFGTLASSGVKAETSGTALRNMYLRLTSGTREVDKVLKRYNVSIQDSKGKMRPMIEILDEIGNKTKGLDDKTRQAALSHLFGARAVNSAMILMKAGKGTVQDYQKKLEGAAGAADDLAQRMGQSIPNRLASLKSKMIETGLKIIDAFKDKIPNAIDSTIKAIDNIDTTKVVDGIMSVITTVKEYSGLIEAVVAAVVIYNTTVKAAAAVQWALNIAMAANPVGAVILLVTGLGLAIYGLIRYGKEVGAWFEGFWGDIAFGFMSTIDKMSFGHLEAIVGKGAAANFRAEQELRRRRGRKSIAGAVNDADLAALAGEGGTSSMFGENGVSDVFNRYGTAFDMENERNAEAQQTNNLSSELLFGQNPQPSELNINFLNAPLMSVEQKQGRGAPLIRHNLGNQ